MEHRREFIFSIEELEFLNASFPDWETIRQSNMQWLLLHEFPVPAGYNLKIATAAIQIPSDYPDVPLDMVYFYPHIKREDGLLIRCTDSIMSIDSKDFQRWSRHYTGLHPWQQGEDSLITHVIAIKNWLSREFQTKRG